MSQEPTELKDILSEHQLFCARFSSCGTFLFAGSMDGGVRRWVLEKKAEPAPEAPSVPAPADALSDVLADPTAPPSKPAPKAPAVAATQGAQAKKPAAKPVSPWELNPLPPFEGFNGWVQTLGLHPVQNRMFAADSWGKIACAEYGADPVKKLWEKTGAHDGWIRRLSVSPDGSLLATCGLDGFVRIWNSADGSPVSAFDAGADVFALSFTPDGARVVFGDMFGKIAVLDFKAAKVLRTLDGAVLHKLDRLQDIGGLRALAFSKDGKKLVAAGLLPKNGGTVQGNPMLLYFDFESGKLDQQFTHGEVKDGYIEDIALTPGGQVIAVASGIPGNGLFFFHSLGEKAPSFVSNKLANCISVALHPGGRHFVVTSTNKASAGNGRRLTKDGEYLGNNSPVHLFEIPA